MVGQHDRQGSPAHVRQTLGQERGTVPGNEPLDQVVHQVIAAQEVVRQRRHTLVL